MRHATYNGQTDLSEPLVGHEMPPLEAVDIDRVCRVLICFHMQRVGQHKLAALVEAQEHMAIQVLTTTKHVYM